MKPNGGAEWRSSGHRLIAEIHRASDRMSKAADRFLLPWGLTSAQYDLLVVLGPHVAGLGHAQAGTRLGVTRSNVTGLVRRLVARGLCRVDVRLDDARAKTVRATPAGTRLLARIDGPWHKRILRTTRGIPGHLQNRLADAAECLEPAPRVHAN